MTANWPSLSASLCQHPPLEMGVVDIICRRWDRLTAWRGDRLGTMDEGCILEPCKLSRASSCLGFLNGLCPHFPFPTSPSGFLTLTATRSSCSDNQGLPTTADFDVTAWAFPGRRLIHTSVFEFKVTSRCRRVDIASRDCAALVRRHLTIRRRAHFSHLSLTASSTPPSTSPPPSLSPPHQRTPTLPPTPPP